MHRIMRNMNTRATNRMVGGRLRSAVTKSLSERTEGEVNVKMGKEPIHCSTLKLPIPCHKTVFLTYSYQMAKKAGYRGTEGCFCGISEVTPGLVLQEYLRNR